MKKYRKGIYVAVSALTILAGMVAIRAFAAEDAKSCLLPSTSTGFSIWNFFPKCDLENCNYTLDALIMVVVGLIRFILSITGTGALVMFVYAGFQLMISQGEPGKIKAGKETIKNALIGLTIIFSAWLIVNTLIGFLIDPTKVPTSESKYRIWDKERIWLSYSANPCVPFNKQTIGKVATPAPSAAVQTYDQVKQNVSSTNKEVVEQHCQDEAVIGSVKRTCTVVKTGDLFECQCKDSSGKTCLQYQIASTSCQATCQQLGKDKPETYSGRVYSTDSKGTYSCCTCARIDPASGTDSSKLCGSENEQCCTAKNAQGKDVSDVCRYQASPHELTCVNNVCIDIECSTYNDCQPGQFCTNGKCKDPTGRSSF